jgi:hypothetical protein
MRLYLAIVLCAFTVPAWGQSQFQIHGFLTGREIYVKAQPSWSEGGIGRFDVGAAGPGDHRTVNVDVAQLGADWTPAGWLLLHADGIARKEPAGTAGRRAGLLQGFADFHTEKLRLRAGAFWLPTSRENVDPLWTSPYTVTDSALNTWIGEEVRPVGVDLQFSPSFYFTLGATAFRGNDTMGTELAARGWSFGDRLSVYGENLPLPDGGTTRPVGPDLDNKNGYAERIRFQLPERALLQVTHIDNRAERVRLLKGQTPWDTRFTIVGGTLGTTSPSTISAEWVKGSTTVGFPGGSFTMDFDTAYILLSQKSGISRWSLRVERFSTNGYERSANDSSREHGHAVTVAWFLSPSEHLRWGTEYARVRGDRPGAAAAGFNPNSGGSTVTLELRYAF